MEKNTEMVVKLGLNNNEEELLNRLANVFKCSPEHALESAIMIGSSWDTFIYEKIASALWQMNGCSYEEYQNLINEYKQEVEEDWKAYRAEKATQRKTGKLIV